MTLSNKLIHPLKTLQFSKKAWFVSLLIAQCVFVTYLALGYGFSAATANIDAWNKFNQTAYVENDILGNTLYGLHVLLAIVMIIGGSMQLIPQIRQRFSRFHRINGRVFVLFACIISIAGLILINTRGTVGNFLMHSLTSFSGLVVLTSSYFAVMAARKHKIAIHQTWAIRLFLAANGVLFFRLMLFAWLLGFGTLGINFEDFTGPTVVSISVCSYVVPLLIFECVRFAEKSKKSVLCYLCCALLIMISLIFLVGLFGISAGSWFPAVMA
ncbi:DUF2306 domain-containing protein [Glaciecola sp. 2405UD65-10]|uniref:DUF2306 domain-containing protein n=1 Tax=Glaciecola sp. 2405UD65-10 TaxID=3397244 RepID=UPI003B5B5A92